MLLASSRPRSRILAIITLFVLVICRLAWHLTTPLPVKSSYGRISTSSSPQYAYATLLTGAEEAYFTAARVLTYQLLFDPETRTNISAPFIIMVTSEVPESQRRKLSDEGATVVLVEDIELPDWVLQRLYYKPGEDYWKDQFVKLRLFQMTQYDRVLYLDVDQLIRRPLDKIFDDPAVATAQNTALGWSAPSMKGALSPTARPPVQYVFAARPDAGPYPNGDNKGGSENHPIPPLEREGFNAGFWVAAPSTELFNYYMAFLHQPTWSGKYLPFEPQFMEQAMLNRVHSRAHVDPGDGREGMGMMPWASLDWRWSATYPHQGDWDAGVAVLHAKFWKQGITDGQELWRQKFKEMEAHANVAKRSVMSGIRTQELP